MRVLFLLLGLLLPPLTAQATDEAPRRDELILAGPAAIVSYPLFRMIESGALEDYAAKVRFRHWQNPDQLRALVVSGQAHASAVPTNVAAMFYNRGESAKLLNVSVWGLLWLVCRDPQVTRLKQLQDQALLIPFRNDMPDIIFRRLSEAMQLPADQSFQVHYVANAMNAVQMVMAEKANHAVLPEPAVSVLLMRNQQRGDQPLYRAIELSALWAEQFPEQPHLPQAGLMATRLLAGQPQLQQAISVAYTEAAGWCQEHIDECAQLAHKYLPQTPVKAAIEALRHNGLKSRSASAVRGELEAFFRQVAKLDPNKIGGRLPAAEFYGR